MDAPHRSRRGGLPALVLFVPIVLSAALLACSRGDDVPPPFPEGARPPDGGGAGVPTAPTAPPPQRDAAVASDADASDAAAPLDGGPCNSLTLGAPVQPMQLAQDGPQLTGGVLTDGTYKLTAVPIYTGVGGATGPLGDPIATTMVVTGGGAVVEVVTQTGSMPARHATYTYSTGFQLNTKETCPPTGSLSLHSYLATPTTIQLQEFDVTSDNHVFTRQ